MVKIASIEDSMTEEMQLSNLLNRYFADSTEGYQLDHFDDPLLFLDQFRHQYDIIFMDIELPHLDGMSAARRIREIDENVILIFLTRMAQFAINGYEVDALDYVVKPVSYPSLRRKLDKARSVLQSNAEYIVVSQKTGMRRIRLQKILYIEVLNHMLTFHMENESLQCMGKLSDLEDQLRGKGFLRCNKSFLVNHRYISSVQKGSITLDNGEVLLLSRLRKAEFMEELTQIAGSLQLL